MEKFNDFCRAWFVNRHGEGEAHQPDLYRCYHCGSIVTWNMIKKGKSCSGACKKTNKLIPGEATWLETLKLMVTRT